MFQGRKTTTRAPPRRDEGRQTDRGNRLTENEYVYHIESKWVRESTRYSLIVNFPDVLHTGLLYGCMA